MSRPSESKPLRLPTRRILALKLVDVGSDETIEDFCDRINLTPKEYREIVEDPKMFEEVWDISFAHIMIKSIPEIMLRWRDKIMTGDTSALKLFMQCRGKMQPERHEHLHLHKEVQGLSGEALDKRIKDSINQYKSLEKEAM